MVRVPQFWIAYFALQMNARCRVARNDWLSNSIWKPELLYQWHGRMLDAGSMVWTIAFGALNARSYGSYYLLQLVVLLDHSLAV